jgi:hypothetical protein
VALNAGHEARIVAVVPSGGGEAIRPVDDLPESAVVAVDALLRDGLQEQVPVVVGGPGGAARLAWAVA